MGYNELVEQAFLCLARARAAETLSLADALTRAAVQLQRAAAAVEVPPAPALGNRPTRNHVRLARARENARINRIVTPHPISPKKSSSGPCDMVRRGGENCAIERASNTMAFDGDDNLSRAARRQCDLPHRRRRPEQFIIWPGTGEQGYAEDGGAARLAKLAGAGRITWAHAGHGSSNRRCTYCTLKIVFGIIP
jgi:hypothetical protein